MQFLSLHPLKQNDLRNASRIQNHCSIVAFSPNDPVTVVFVQRQIRIFLIFSFFPSVHVKDEGEPIHHVSNEE